MVTIAVANWADNSCNSIVTSAMATMAGLLQALALDSAHDFFSVL
jgi:hypothetical protein